MKIQKFKNCWHPEHGEWDTKGHCCWSCCSQKALSKHFHRKLTGRTKMWQKKKVIQGSTSVCNWTCWSSPWRLNWRSEEHGWTMTWVIENLHIEKRCTCNREKHPLEVSEERSPFKNMGETDKDQTLAGVPMYSCTYIRLQSEETAPSSGSGGLLCTVGRVQRESSRSTLVQMTSCLVGPWPVLGVCVLSFCSELFQTVVSNGAKFRIIFLLLWTLN